MKTQIQKRKRKPLLMASSLFVLGSILLSPGFSRAATIKTRASKVPTVISLAENQLGDHHKIIRGKDVEVNPLAGVPSREGKPAGQSPMPGGIAVSTDPSARPDLANFQKKLTDLFGKEVDLSRGEDGLSKLKGMADSLLLLFGSSTDESGEDLQPGDTPYGNEESMVGADGDQKKTGGATGTTIAPSTTDDEGLHAGDGGKTAERYKGTTLGNVGTAIGTGLPSTPTGQALQQALNEQDGKSSSSNSGSGGNNSGSNNSGNNNSGNGGSGTEDPNPITDYHTSEDGKTSVWKYKDGTVVVRNNEKQTTTTQYPDGTIVDEDKDGKKTTTPPPSIPDPDHQGASLPAVIQKQLDADRAALRAIGPKKEPGNIDFGGEGADAGMPVGTADKSGEVPDKKKGLITNPGSSEATTPAHPSLDQDKPPMGPDETVIHVE